jgi:tyrosyl-tRNA synthetase
VHLQRAVHRPIALVGGATGMVGDPSGKSDERNLLDEATLAKNIAGVRAQLEKFLDFKSKDNAATLVNNYDWMKKFFILAFYSRCGKTHHGKLYGGQGFCQKKNGNWNLIH